MIGQRLARVMGLALLAAVGCGDNDSGDAGRAVFGIGAKCVLSDEFRTDFSGFSRNEVVIEPGTGACQGVCMATGFQGRTSCPYGQSAGAGECQTPDGKDVEVAVEPQLVLRPPQHATICSCRCAGPGPGPFCDCGEGMECAPLVAAIGSDDDAAGSYCVPEGTVYSPDTYVRALCSAASGNCDDRISGD